MKNTFPCLRKMERKKEIDRDGNRLPEGGGFVLTRYNTDGLKGV